MSYVIQNFIFDERNVVLTLRIKYLILLKNFNIIFFFYKTTSLYWLFLSKPVRLKKASIILFRSFFVTNWLLFFYKKQLLLPTYYSNNLYASIIYWNLNSIIKQFPHFSFFFLNFNQILIFNNPVFNQYFYPIKTCDLKINKMFFDKVIFFFFFHGTFAWFDFEKSFNFLTSYMIVQPIFKISFFYSSFFFNVYNN